ncbi:MAG: DUF3047 domain-containing protein [Longimicrobiales bacterium]|nr:DUF3047 domain-containing protein [Longimicrobiales bacterium]
MDEGAASLDRAYAGWSELLRSGNGIPENRARALVARAFALDEMSAEILDDRWPGLGASERSRFRDALAGVLTRELLTAFDGFGEVPALRPADEEWSRSDGHVTARYWLVGEQRSDWFAFRLRERSDGGCGILDVRRGDRSLLGSLEGRVDRLVDDFSFPSMVAEFGGLDYVVLEDFEDDEVDSLPRGWTWRDGDNNKNKPYRVKDENGNRYLEATDEGESVILGREISWNLNEFPYISFRVRVNRIPVGGNERDDDKVDSAAGLYFTLNKRLLGTIPQSIKYVWSSTLPVGVAVQRDGIGRPWQVVFGTGEEGLGEWRTYTFDLRQAFRDTFGGNPPKATVGLGILSDANSVSEGQAYADYDDIRAYRSAPASVTSGVREKLPPLKQQ